MNQPAEITFVDFKCPHCEGPLSFPETSINAVQECPVCFQILVVPEKGVEVGKKLPIPLKTSRLLLRRLDPADSAGLIELMDDEESFRYIDWDPLDEAEVEDWIAKDQKTRLIEQGASLCLAVELLENAQFAGFVSLYFLDERRIQMGFTMMINSSYRRQGFGTETLRAAAHVAFKGLRQHRLSVLCDTRNTAAFRMLEKARFRREGKCIKDTFQKGEWIDTFWYALLQDEYVQTT